MGADKAAFDYHGAPQARWAFELLGRHCERVVVSVRDATQAAAPAYAGLPAVLDLDPGSGPAAGLAAAFGLEPRSAWLVVAADMPLLDDELLRGLVAARDPRKVATAYRHPDGTLEPLCTIWEPAAVPLLEACGAPRRSVSLRRVLEGAPVHAIAARDPKRLGSVNTAAEDEAARTYLAGTGAATSEP